MTTPPSISLKPGNIIGAYSAQAGKPKYFLCLSPYAPDVAARFLFLNSEPGKQDSLDLLCPEIPCLPVSSTGFSCICCNTIVRMNETQLGLFRAYHLGHIDVSVKAKLGAFVSAGVTSLRSQEVRFLAASIAVM